MSLDVFRILQIVPNPNPSHSSNFIQNLTNQCSVCRHTSDGSGSQRLHTHSLTSNISIVFGVLSCVFQPDGSRCDPHSSFTSLFVPANSGENYLAFTLAVHFVCI